MRFITLALALAVVAAACSASGEFSIGTPTIENATEDLIENEIADQIGLGELDATCTKPASEDVGTRFLCTATTGDGQTIDLQAEIDEDGAVAETTNLVVASKLEEVEAIVLAEIEQLSGLDLSDDALDCGSTSLIVDSQNQIFCAVTDPTGAVFDSTITFRGLDTNDPTFDFVVANEPRSDS
jgi:hypothetical protein